MLADDLAKKLAKGAINWRTTEDDQRRLMMVHKRTGIKSLSELLRHVLHEYTQSAEQKQGAA